MGLDTAADRLLSGDEVERAMWRTVLDGAVDIHNAAQNA